MSNRELQARLEQAVSNHDVDLVIQAIRDGAEVDDGIVLYCRLKVLYKI